MPANLKKNTPVGTKFDELPKWKQNALLKEKAKAESVQLTKAEIAKQEQLAYEKYLEKYLEKKDYKAELAYRHQAIKMGEAEYDADYNFALQDYKQKIKQYNFQTPPNSDYSAVRATKPLSITFNPELNINRIVPRKDKKIQGKFWETPEFQKIIQGITHGDFSVLTNALTNKAQKTYGPPVPAGPDGLLLQLKAIVQPPITAPVELPPRYPFIQVPMEIMGRDGKPTTIMRAQPFFIEDKTAEEQYATEVANTPDNMHYNRLVPVIKYAFNKLFRSGFGKHGVVVGGGTEKELIFQENPNSTQAVFQLLFNAGVVGYEFLDATVSSIVNNGKMGLFNATNYNFTTGLPKYTQTENTKGDWEDIHVAWNITKDSWNTFIGALEKEKEQQAPGGVQPTSRAEYGKLQRSIILANVSEREQADVASKNFHAQAEENQRLAFESDDPAKREELLNSALQLEIASIEQGRIADPYDAWGAATWVREPEKYKMFLENAATVQLGLGRPLTILEIRRLKETYANMWTEIAFEATFDVTNFLPIVGEASKAIGLTEAVFAPFSWAMDVIKNSKAATKITETATKSLSFISKTRVGEAVTPVFRWLASKSVRSTGDKISQRIFGLFDRMGMAYGTMDEFALDMPKIENLSLRLQSVAPDLAEETYKVEKASGRIKGLANIEYSEFRGLKEAPPLAKDTSWYNLFQNSISNTSERQVAKMMKADKTLTREMAEILVKKEIKKTGEPIIAFSKAFEKAFIDSHLIHKGSRLTDDTISGMLVKALRDKAGIGVDNKLMKSSLKAGEKANMKMAADVIETTVAVAQTVRGLWTAVVLTTPRWVLTNLVDSMGRDLVYGGNMFGDIFSLVYSTQKHFADEVEHLPMVLGSNLARAEVDYFESVPALLLHGDVKPAWGPFSYWAYEAKKLKTERAELIAEEVAKRYEGKTRSLWNRFWDGVATSPLKAKDQLEAFAHGISDFNTSIEFTLRTRMFHREYFKMLRQLESKFKTEGMESLSPVTRDLALRIWRESGGNASKIAQMVDNVVGQNAGSGNQLFNLMLPADWDEFLVKAGMTDPEQIQIYTYDLTRQFDLFRQSAIKTYGREATPEELDRFVEIAKAKVQFHANEAINARDLLKGVDPSINPAKVPVENITAANLNGSHPSKANVQDALSALIKPRLFTSKAVIAGNYKTVLEGIGEVKVVPGKVLSQSFDNGKSIFTIGSDFDTLKISEQKAAIYQLVIQHIADMSEPVLSKLNIGRIEFEKLLVIFTSDPAEALRLNRKAFVVILDTLVTTPEYEGLIKSTGKFASYEGALSLHEDQLFREWKRETAYMSMFEKPGFMEWKKEYSYASPERRAAGIARRTSFDDMMPIYKAHSKKAFSASLEFRERFQLFSDRFREYVYEVFPGYRAEAKGALRTTKWSKGEMKLAEMDNIISEINADFIKQLKAKPKNALEIMEQYVTDMPDILLRRAGIELTWDAEHTDILSLTIRDTLNVGDKAITSSRSGNSGMIDQVLARFYGVQSRPASAPLRLIEIDGDIEKQLYFGFREIAGLNSDQSRTVAQMLMNHARQWAKETGRDAKEYYARYGFQQINEIANLDKGSMAINNDAFIKFAKDKITLYGTGDKNLPMVLSQLSSVFYADLLEMKGMADPSVKTINRFIKEVTGLTVKDGKLNEKQAQAFARIMQEYIMDGDVSHGSLKRPMDKMRTWLLDEYQAIQGSLMAEKLPEDVQKALNLAFIQEKIQVQPNELDVLRQLTKKFKNITPEQIAETIKGKLFKGNIEDVSQSEMLFALKEIDPEAARAAEEQLNNLNSAFDAYKLKRNISRFPDEVKVNSTVFKQYLRERIATEPLAIGHVYENMLYDLQNMENAVLTGDTINPAVRPYMMSKGVKNALANAEDIAKNYDAALKGIDHLATFMKEGKHIPPVLSAESIEELLRWKDIAVPAKSKLVKTLIDGGEIDGKFVEGATSKVNKVMLDYTDQYNLDVLMKNLFPFWMFPSRSLPFWMKTLTTHPQILAAYNKIQRFSRAQRFQSGAVTSKGRPLPSLEGYTQIPGTDIWFNPLAQFSFKYILNLLPDEYDYYEGNTSNPDDTLDPLSKVAQELFDKSSVLGFSMAPWMSYPLKQALGLPDSVVPNFPLIPEILLVPRWVLMDYIEKSQKTSWFGTFLQDTVYPEASFHDTLTEKYLLEQAMKRMEEPGANKAAIIEEVRVALEHKGQNALWVQAYHDLTNTEALFSAASFFTGVYAKQFTDATADMYALRNEINLMKSGMNNQLQTNIFKLPPTAEDSWKRYLNLNASDEGTMLRLYSSLNWIRNDKGQVVTDPKERNIYLQLAIQDDKNQEAYYAQVSNLRQTLDAALALPIGSSWAVKENAYKEYFDGLAKAKKNFPFSYNRSWGSNKPVELLMNDLQDIFYYALISSRPVWSDKLSEEENTARLKEWEAQLPKVGKTLLSIMLQDGEQSYHYKKYYGASLRDDAQVIIDSLHPEQIIPPEFWTTLEGASNKDALYNWQKTKDSVIDALNNAWKTMYWDEYWNAVSGKDSTDRDLIDADFAANRPPPTAEELYQWISTEYGPNRFTLEEIRAYVNGSSSGTPHLDVMSIDEAKFQRYGKVSAKQQEVWDMLSWLGPHKDFPLMNHIQAELQALGVPGGAIQKWFDYSGNQYANDEAGLDLLIQSMKQVYADLGIIPPRREYLVAYAQAQDTNKKYQEMENQKFASDIEFTDLIRTKEKWVSTNPASEFYNKTPLEVIQDWERLYFAKSGDKAENAYQLTWRTENPKEWTYLQEYWADGRAFAKTDANWAMYYKYATIPEQFEQAVSGIAGSYAKYLYVRGKNKFTKNKYVYQGISTSSNTGVASAPDEFVPEQLPPAAMIAIPSQLKATMGSMLVNEVEKLFKDGTQLDPSAVDFLKGVSDRHPEWKPEIDDILIQNQTP